MAEVFVVIGETADDVAVILGVFSTQEKAQEQVADALLHNGFPSASVCPWTLDKPLPRPASHWRVTDA